MANSINEVQKRIGKNLREIRRKAKMTQIRLAIELEKGSNYISQIERGIKMPSIKRLTVISEILKVDISEFFKKD